MDNARPVRYGAATARWPFASGTTPNTRFAFNGDGPNEAKTVSSIRAHLPNKTLLKLLIAWGVVIVFAIGGPGWLHDPIDPVVAIACFAVIFTTILVAAFGVVHEADYLAHQLGEPYGTLILTLSIVTIEVILIAAVLLGPGENPTIGRDSIFAVMMIILNLVMGICLLVGGRRFGEQEYNSQGAMAYVSMTLLLAGIGLILPNTLSTGDGTFHPVQSIAFALLTLILYGVFLLMQTRGYKRFFVQPEPGSLAVPAAPAITDAPAEPKQAPDRRGIVVRSLLLVALMVPIVLLAHDLALVIDFGIAAIGAPVALGGVLIAIIVFTPESITAIRAALDNQLQRSINLCLGAFVSTVGLTVPAVLTVGLVTGKTVIMGVSPTETVLLLLTIGLTALTFIGQRASALQGTLHLTLFAVFALLLFVP
jgi:Ca2+:H+ antiporter